MYVGQHVCVKTFGGVFSRYDGLTGVIVSIRRYYEVAFDYPINDNISILFNLHELAPYTTDPLTINKFLIAALLTRINNE